MLTVVTPATGARLTTLEAARALLGFASADDPVATVCIDQASRTIVDHCRRPFGIETVRETFRGLDRGDGFLLARSPVVEVLFVLEDGAVLTTDDYEVDGQTGRLHRLDGYGHRLRSWCGSSLTVEYDAGYVLPGASTPTLPESVQRAAILLTGAYLATRNRDATIRSETIEGIGSTSWYVPTSTTGLISPEAEQLLAPYRRIA